MRALNTALAALALLIPASALAQTWPDRSIRLVVPFPAGGPTDIIARVVGQAMTDALGQPVVIDNRGGAGGVTGTDQVARAAPDGYTLALSSAGALSISPSLQRMPYNSTKDLAPITLVAKVPELLVVPAASSSKTLEDFVAAAKAKPGGFNYASTGPGGMPHLAAELLKATAKIDMVHVPYSGAAPAVTDLLGARTDMMFADIPVLLPHVQGGALRALAVGSAQRMPMLPDVPTTAEKGLPARPLDRSPPQEPEDGGWFSSGPVAARSIGDDEAGGMARIQAQAMPELGPSEQPRRSGGLLGWLFGSGDEEPPPRREERDRRD